MGRFFFFKIKALHPWVQRKPPAENKVDFMNTFRDILLTASQPVRQTDRETDRRTDGRTHEHHTKPNPAELAAFNK